jgi:hypothetical protein
MCHPLWLNDAVFRPRAVGKEERHPQIQHLDPRKHLPRIPSTDPKSEESKAHCKMIIFPFSQLGKRIDKITMIVDLEGFGMKELFQPGMDLILRVMAFEEANYPETLKVCYVINCKAHSCFPF